MATSVEEAAVLNALTPITYCRAVPDAAIERAVVNSADSLIGIFENEAVRRQYVEYCSPKAAISILGPLDPQWPGVLSGQQFVVRDSNPASVAYYPDKSGKRALRPGTTRDGAELVPAAYVIGLSLLSGLVDLPPDPGDEITLTVRVTIESASGEFGWFEARGIAEYNLLSLDWSYTSKLRSGLITWLKPGDEVPAFFTGVFAPPSDT